MSCKRVVSSSEVSHRTIRDFFIKNNSVSLFCIQREFPALPSLSSRPCEPPEAVGMMAKRKKSMLDAGEGAREEMRGIIERLQKAGLGRFGTKV